MRILKNYRLYRILDNGKQKISDIKLSYRDFNGHHNDDEIYEFTDLLTPELLQTKESFPVFMYGPTVDGDYNVLKLCDDSIVAKLSNFHRKKDYLYCDVIFSKNENAKLSILDAENDTLRIENHLPYTFDSKKKTLTIRDISWLVFSTYPITYCMQQINISADIG